MVKILFVCHGNICRSPMAEYIFRDMAEKAGVADEFIVSSAGVSREEEGNPVYPPARRLLHQRGIDSHNHRARQITQADCDNYDYIIYMDTQNARYLRRMFPNVGKFTPLLPRDVADPWYYGGFEQVYFDICEGCGKLLEDLL